MTDAEEIGALLEDMRSGDENRLINAGPMLAQFGSEAVAGLLATLENDQPLVRDYSAFALGMIGAASEVAIPALCKATKDNNANVRYAAIKALGNIGRANEEVINCLLDSLSDADEANQRGARNTLKTLKGV